MKEEELFKILNKKTEGKLTIREMSKIVSSIDLTEKKIPKIICTDNPYNFEYLTRNREDTSKDKASNDVLISYIQDTTVVIGDYIPGLDKQIEYNMFGEEEELEYNFEDSDFSLEKTQVAIVEDKLINNVTGISNNTPYDYITVYIYIPNEKEYPNHKMFKELTVKTSEEIGEDLAKITNNVLIADAFHEVIGENKEVVKTQPDDEAK